MSEEILEQTAPAEKKGLIQKILENKLLVFLPAAMVVLAIILGYFADIISPFLSGVPFRYLFKIIYVSYKFLFSWVRSKYYITRSLISNSGYMI